MKRFDFELNRDVNKEKLRVLVYIQYNKKLIDFSNAICLYSSTTHFVCIK